MLINDLLKKLQDIEEQQENLKQQKKDLIKQAKIDRVLEVNLNEFVKCLSDILEEESSAIYINPIYIPKHLCNNFAQIKDYIITHNMGLGIKIKLFNTFTFTMPIKDIRLLNDELLIDHLQLKKQSSTLFVPAEITPLIMLNIDLNNKNMEKEFFKEAVFKCVEKREQENQKNL